MPAGTARTTSSQTVNTRRLSVSLDLDNLWSYLKARGDQRWTTLPSYLDRLVDVLLPWLERHEMRITVFVVGQDAALAANRSALHAIAEAGHEIANHSFHHDPWLERLDGEELAREVALAEEQIVDATGQHPIGFRAPGYSYTDSLPALLVRRGYLYDASMWPTFIGPLARWYSLRRSASLSASDRERRGHLFGRLGDGWGPLRAHFRSAGGQFLVEIPVTTIPVVRLPFHMTYIGYLAGWNERVAITYLSAALKACRAWRVDPSFLLHPPDFLGGELVPELGFFPTMQLSTRRKLQLLDRVVSKLRGEFTLCTMAQHAAALRGREASTEPVPATMPRVAVEREVL